MIERLEKYFKEHLQTNNIQNTGLIENKIYVATAVLFLEMAYADFEIDPQEEKEIVAALENLFKLEPKKIDSLLQAAKAKRAEANDIFHFTNLIKEHYSRKERIFILEKLWLLIFSDGRVDKYEEALIRKITTLLGLEHGEMIQAKLNMRKQSINLNNE